MSITTIETASRDDTALQICLRCDSWNSKVAGPDGEHSGKCFGDPNETGAVEYTDWNQTCPRFTPDRHPATDEYQSECAPAFIIEPRRGLTTDAERIGDTTGEHNATE